MKNILKLFTFLFLISNTAFAFDSCYVYTLNCITDSEGNIVKKDDTIKANTRYKYSSMQIDGDTQKSFSCITKDKTSNIKKTPKTYNMDLNAYLDNEYYTDSLYFLRADIYINNELILKDMTDFTAGNWYDDPNLGTAEWVLENGFPCGTTYRFVIKEADGYKCVKNCDVKGTVSGGSDGSWGVKIIPYIETIK